jgi:hypothetical protein
MTKWVVFQKRSRSNLEALVANRRPSRKLVGEIAESVSKQIQNLKTPVATERPWLPHKRREAVYLAVKFFVSYVTDLSHFEKEREKIRAQVLDKSSRLQGKASAHFVAAHGDSLFAEGEGEATPTETPGVFTVVEVYPITGGTSRFVGASGIINLDRIVDTNTGDTSGTISGNIVIL